MDHIELLARTRKLLIRITECLTDEQLVEIPTGFRNNILWNMGHLVVTQQILHYKLSGLVSYVRDEMTENLKKGTSPSDWGETPDISEIRDLLVQLPRKLNSDYSSGRFQSFTRYDTSAGIPLDNIDDAIVFNNFHEGMHTGIIMSQVKHLE